MPQDIQDFKNCLSMFTTGITIVTTRVDNSFNLGITVNSFNSVSLSPCLILFSLSKSSSNYKKFVSQRHFCVNILSATQQELCKKFARPSDVDWSKINFSYSEVTNSPIIEGSMAIVDCNIYNIYDGGDHDIIVGKVQDYKILNKTEPLVYFNHQFCKIKYSCDNPGT